MAITSAEIASFVGSFLWPLTRIGAALAMLPFFGAMTIPLRVRVLLAFALTVILWPGLPVMPTADPLGPDGMVLIAEQVVIGVAMGMILQAAFGAVVFGGQAIANSMGLGFASMADPQNGTQVPILSQFFTIMVTLLFLAADGHLVLLRMLSLSFETLPVGGGLPSGDVFARLARLGGLLIAGGLMLALPVIVATLMTSVAFGVVSRTAPQLNLFSIGFPASLVVGFAALLFTVPHVLARTATLFDAAFAELTMFLGG